MATVVRNTDPVVATEADTRNLIKKQIGAGSAFHLDASEVTVAAANASSLSTSLTLCVQMMKIFDGVTGNKAYPGHRQDTLAHKAADTTALAHATSTVVDLASAITAANDLKAKFNTHIASTTFHYNADATNTIATADATDQTSLNTLLNAIKTALNAHVASAPTNNAPSVRLIDA